MPAEIQRDDVRRLIGAGAQVVDVLPPQEYQEEHLPTAVNVPLKEIKTGADRLQRDRPVITYCHDYQ
jgi:rhodanese-related sulfurtransferase